MPTLLLDLCCFVSWVLRKNCWVCILVEFSDLKHQRATWTLSWQRLCVHSDDVIAQCRKHAVSRTLARELPEQPTKITTIQSTTECLWPHCQVKYQSIKLISVWSLSSGPATPPCAKGDPASAGRSYPTAHQRLHVCAAVAVLNVIGLSTTHAKSLTVPCSVSGC